MIISSAPTTFGSSLILLHLCASLRICASGLKKIWVFWMLQESEVWISFHFQTISSCERHPLDLQYDMISTAWDLNSNSDSPTCILHVLYLVWIKKNRCSCLNPKCLDNMERKTWHGCRHFLERRVRLLAFYWCWTRSMLEVKDDDIQIFDLHAEQTLLPFMKLHLNFWTQHCGPCSEFCPLFAQICVQHPDFRARAFSLLIL